MRPTLEHVHGSGHIPHTFTRRHLEEGLRELADADFQRRVWAAEEPRGQMSSFEECVCAIFDDSGVGDALDKGWQVFGEETDEALRSLLAQVTSGRLTRRSPQELLNDSAMASLRDQAAALLAAMPSSARTLWRPVGQAELDLIAAEDWEAFPPRLEHQPIFYPVLTFGYAAKIAGKWNTKDPASGFVGYVTEFDIDDAFVSCYATRRVGGEGVDELWVPAAELPAFNEHIIGLIRLVATFESSAPHHP